MLAGAGMKDPKRVDLAAEALRAEDAWHSGGAAYVPLSVAAAITFHQVHRSSKAIVTRNDYNDALNIAASALARLIPILALRNSRDGRVAIAIDPVRQRFTRGATELRHDDGTAIRNLSVRVPEFHSALSRIKHTGVLGACFAITATDLRAPEAAHGLAAPGRGLAAELILAEQRERRRISRVLHEELAQVITGCRMHVDAVMAELDSKQRERLARVVDSLNLAYDTTLGLALELTSPELAEFGLVRTLRSFASEQAALHGLKVSVYARAEDEPQDIETRVFLFDAARVLLRNVARHAQVREAAVKLAAAGDLLELTVSDSGAGFDPGAVRWHGQPCSLSHLEERADALGGSLSVRSRPGGGARICVRIPRILESGRYLAAELSPR
jgi:signal transduction histidine kinase